MKIIKELRRNYVLDQAGIFIAGSEGYWSNLSKKENEMLISLLDSHNSREALQKCQPWLDDVIYSPKRQAGLELLGLKGTESCIDYGCMWGALTIPLAKRTDFVLGIDQTYDSLKLLRARVKEENLHNIELLCADIKNLPRLSDPVDIAIINGVLEWIPEHGVIELKSYYGRRSPKEFSDNPREQQLEFLKNVYLNLKDGGKVYLAIENRYDFKCFFGAKDPHANLLFTSFLPRKLANLISIVRLGRPYVNWIYSFRGISLLLKESGFSKIDLYACFPDYRFPERIIPFNNQIRNFQLTISSRNSQGKRTLKRLLARTMEFIIFNKLQLKSLAPSIIAVGYKL